MAVLFVCLLLAVLAGTRAEQCCVKVDKGTKQLIDAEGRMGMVCRTRINYLINNYPELNIIIHYPELISFFCSILHTLGRARLFHGVNVVRF